MTNADSSSTPSDMNEYSLFLGRYQPLHDGHEKLIRTELERGKKVIVAVRNMPISKDNPYNYEQIKEMFRQRFHDEVEIISVPNITAVCHGRKVGWEVRHIKLDEEMESISATKIRNDNMV